MSSHCSSPISRFALPLVAFPVSQIPVLTPVTDRRHFRLCAAGQPSYPVRHQQTRLLLQVF